MEAGDPSVSLELLIRALLRVGAISKATYARVRRVVPGYPARARSQADQAIRALKMLAVVQKHGLEILL